MLANALDGSGGHGASTAYLEAFRIITRVGVSDKSFIVKLAAAGCLKTFASIGGPGLGISELESSIAYCLKVLLAFVFYQIKNFFHYWTSILIICLIFETCQFPIYWCLILLLLLLLCTVRPLRIQFLLSGMLSQKP